MSFTDINTVVGTAFPDTFFVDVNFIGNYYPNISIDTLNKRWYVKLSGLYYKLVNKHFLSVGPSDLYFWILDSQGEIDIQGQTLNYTNGDSDIDISATYGYIDPSTVLSDGGPITFGVASSDFNLTTTGNQTYYFQPQPPQIIPRPIVGNTNMTFTVNSNSDSASTSSLHILLNGPGGGNFSFLPPSYGWYRYNIGGLTSGCNYTSEAFYYNSNSLSSVSVSFRTIYTGNKPSAVINLTNSNSVSQVYLNWNTPSSDGGAPLLGYMIRDLVQNSNYNVPYWISSYTVQNPVIPGNNLFSLEAVNDPGYSPRSYLSTFMLPLLPPLSSSNLYLLLDGAAVSNASSITWIDLSSNANDVTLIAGPVWNSSNAGYFAFDGSNDYALAPNGFADFTNGITILSFANMGNQDSWERIIDFAIGQGNEEIIFSRAGTTNDLIFQIYNGGGSVLTFSVSFIGAITNNAWGFYAVRLDGSTYKLWNQNTTHGGNTNVLPSNVTRTANYIGRSHWPDAYYQENIGILAIYGRALSDSEVSDFFDFYKGRYGL